ncbi:hypothetical protein Goarm_005232, partial [Gossypium armourianum]|nr:hypothetical protein [Gossypium armourianum]
MRMLFGITRCIHEDMNTELIEHFRSEEVREAMKNVAPSKATFVLGKHITDNALIAYDVLQSLKQKKSGVRGHFAMKLDVIERWNICAREKFEILKRIEAMRPTCPNNVSSIKNKQIGATIRVRVSSNLEKYLGLPTMIGKRKKEAFEREFISVIGGGCASRKHKGGLGFKELTKFNIAILAKQGWLLLPIFYLEEHMGSQKTSGARHGLEGWKRETATWKLEVLRKLFVEEQVNKILTILVAEVDLDDERVWRGDSIGVFSAKSGYKWLLSEEVTAAQGEMLQQATLLQNFYNKLWKFQVASKIKITTWKIANNCIPMFDNLQVRNLQVVNICPLCHTIEESVSHIFRDCMFIESVLQGLGVDVSPIWYHRNKVYHQGEKQNIVGLVTFIKAYYSDSTFTESVISTPMNQMNSIWTPPGINEVKCNFDATFNKCMFSSVFGIIFRDSEGHILATCAYPNSFMADATTVQAKACLQAVMVAEELGFRRLVVEGDSLIVIKKIRSSENDRSSISMIIKEIKKGAQGYE